MTKVLVELHVPMINKEIEMFLPLSLKVYEAEELLAKACRDLSKGYFKVENDPILCFYHDGKVLERNKTIYENSIVNGTKLIFL